MRCVRSSRSSSRCAGGQRETLRHQPRDSGRCHGSEGFVLERCLPFPCWCVCEWWSVDHGVRRWRTANDGPCSKRDRAEWCRGVIHRSWWTKSGQQKKSTMYIFDIIMCLLLIVSTLGEARLELATWLVYFLYDFPWEARLRLRIALNGWAGMQNGATVRVNNGLLHILKKKQWALALGF